MIIIDGHNLLKAGVLTGQTSGRYQLVHLAKLLHSSRRLQGASVELIFDGEKPAGFAPAVHGNIHIRFSGKHAIADDLIRQSIRKALHAEKIIVVSNDREIINTAEDCGAKTLSAKNFYEQYLRGGGRPKHPTSAPGAESGGLSRKALKEWLEIFNNRGDMEEDA